MALLVTKSKYPCTQLKISKKKKKKQILIHYWSVSLSFFFSFFLNKTIKKKIKEKGRPIKRKQQVAVIAKLYKH